MDAGGSPRWFILTAGDWVHEAIDRVEAQGHQVVASSMTRACSVEVYGICEIAPPDRSWPAKGDG